MNVASTVASESEATDQDGLFAELEALSTATSNLNTSRTEAVSAWETKPRQRFDFSIWMVSLIVLLIFLAGMFTERFVRILEGSRRSDVSIKEKATSQIADGELTGRIAYRTKQNESQPDRGARILLFPQQRLGEVKLSVVGFRPADAASDQTIANAALKAMGGGAATANEAGLFQLPIEAGTYRLLVLSHFQPREELVNDPAVATLLSEYFDNPNELLGRVQYQLSTIRIKGTGDVWDHSF